ncbi:CBS domain-containing protein [Alteribacillus persepolensis]|uniref:CBS domain-containing protein n=1 Tax=Alteribacillus persepolensis TaxID=568899 RepID=A0A1G8HAH8_9BACI|nr:DUF294 nucleotidyltransferase-like domain-containing protein [Alteribacillus persepolensis]SDI03643.1 CBS domain-containing protein [Alteribacillus persepolensis]
MMVPENKPYYTQIHNHPIFSGASAAEFGAYLEQCQLLHYEKNERLLYSQSPRNGLLLILEGVTEVYVAFHDTTKHAEVLEILEKNDIIGFSSLADFLGEPAHYESSYTVEVRAVEKAVCLYIPYSVIEARWIDEDVRDYVLRQVSVRLRDIYASLAEQVHLAHHWGESNPFIQRVQDMMVTPVCTVDLHTPVTEAAQTMIAENTSSLVVVNRSEEIAGIITEKDVVERVVAANKREGTAEDIMSSNPYIITRHAYYYEAMSSFFINGVKHLPVVDEKNEKHAIGMISLSDLLKKKNRGTFDILQEIEQADEQTLPHIKHAIYDVVATLLQDDIPTFHTLEVITKLYDRLIGRSVELAIESVREKLGEPPAVFAFFLMGSGGRAEQFMLTDQDHFLVYDNTHSEAETEQVEAYFRALGNAIVYWLEQAGYKRCDGNMMASEINWRGTLSHWKDRLRTWGLRATNENILLGHNFLAFRYVYGDPALYDDFVHMVQTQFQQSRIFLLRAAEQEKQHPVPVLDHPIRALFRLKRQGIDIKKHALFPFHHSLQILAAKHGVFGNTPLHLIASLKAQGVISEKTADEWKFAYEVILSIRIKHSWNRYQRNERPTSEIKFTQMKSRDKEELMVALKYIRALQSQMIQSFGIT